MALNQSPDEFARKTLIGFLAQQRVTEAQALADQLSVQFPKHSLSWKVKGVLAIQQARFDEATKLLQKASALAPKDWEIFNSLGLAFKGLGKIKNAQAAYEQAIRLNPDYPSAYANLGDLLREQDRLDDALRTYQKLLMLTPDNQEVQHHVAALSGAAAETAPAGYVSKVFDHYADRFDQHLTEQLQYKVPKDLAEIYRSLADINAEQAYLDLGCGTGLMADALPEVNGPWTGIDLSSKMLDKARAKNRYANLICSDLVAGMQTLQTQSMNVAFAADVFIYVGALESALRELHRVLKPGGHFLFSIEDGDASHDYVLRPSGRFAHHESYIQRLAQLQGWHISKVAPTSIRAERSGHIPGQLFAMQLGTSN